MSGLTGQTPPYTMGRARSSSAPPTTSAHMRKMALHSMPESGPMPSGLVVLSSCASVLWTAAVSGGTSLAPTEISCVSISLR